MMDSRERTFRALNFETPDCVPTDVWVSGGFRRKLEAALHMPLAAILDAHDIDLRYVEGPAYIGPPLRMRAQGDWGQGATFNILVNEFCMSWSVR
jgi:hypothetical protein